MTYMNYQNNYIPNLCLDVNCFFDIKIKLYIITSYYKYNEFAIYSKYQFDCQRDLRINV